MCVFCGPIGSGARTIARTALLGLAALTLATFGREGAAAGEPKNARDLLAGVDGVIVRGSWRVRIALGPPSLRYRASDSDVRAVVATREGSTLTLLQRRPTSGPVAELRVRVPRLRGVAVSGAVDLDVADRSDVPLFLDLSGTGTVRATGAVPLLRVTTSGSVTADLMGLTAATARVHARQHSRLAIRARESLTIVALDSARVWYAAETVYPTLRGTATLERGNAILRASLHPKS